MEKEIENLNLVQEKLVTAETPEGIFIHTSIVRKNKMYVFGGERKSIKWKNSLYALNLGILNILLISTFRYFNLDI